MRSLAIGATGMLAQQTNVDVISNNIANMNTTAYTKRRAEFNDLLYQNIIRPGATSSAAQTVVRPAFSSVWVCVPRQFIGLPAVPV